MVGGGSPQGIVSGELQCLAFEAEPLTAGGLFHQIFIVQAVQLVTQTGKGFRGPSRPVAGIQLPLNQELALCLVEVVAIASTGQRKEVFVGHGVAAVEVPRLIDPSKVQEPGRLVVSVATKIRIR